MFDVRSDTGRKASTAELVKILRCEVDIPVIAAGGIMNGEHIRKIREAGADAVQLGTAFLTAEESGVCEQYRTAVTKFEDRATGLTTAFSGRPARGIRNMFMDKVDPTHAQVLPFPLQNSLTSTIRKEAQAQGDHELLSLWAGTNFSQARFGTVAQLLDELESEAGGL